MLLDKKSPIYKEWKKLEKQESSYLQKRMEKRDSKLNQLLSKKVPENMQNTLDGTFCTAFSTVFEEGTSVIEKTYQKEKLQKDYAMNAYASQVKGDRKSLKAFSKKASSSGNLNLVLSGVSGIGLGALGIGMPDVVLFTGLLLKSVYEIALSYGYNYKDSNEKRFILLIIKGALSYGDELKEINTELNHYCYYGQFTQHRYMDECIRGAAKGLSGELLYMKFLQGFPIVGMAGGAFDVIYMKQVVKYAELKYRRRFYVGKMKQ